MMRVKKSLTALLCMVGVCLPALAQSGASGSRASYREYAVNLTFAVYQYEEGRSPAMQDVTRLGSTFSSADEEAAYLKEARKLQEVAARHVRSVGLREGETFNDAVLLGPEYMLLTMTPRDVARGVMKLDFKARYANESMVDVKGVGFDNYETVLLRGGRGMFGVKYYVGAGGRQESAPAERTLLISITPAIVPVANLRNRPEQLSHPLDEHGGALRLKEDDRFTPPVAVERVTPKFDTGRGVKGAVLVGGTVTPEGKVINIRVLRSIDPIIDDRAVDAFRQYRFTPALLNGQPVHATYREEITFAPPPGSIIQSQEDQLRQREAERQRREAERREAERRRRRWPVAP